jgi:hypothetical protein
MDIVLGFVDVREAALSNATIRPVRQAPGGGVPSEDTPDARCNIKYKKYGVRSSPA